MTEEICKNCGHTEASHPNHFLCYANGERVDEENFASCKCPGWVKKVEGING